MQMLHRETNQNNRALTSSIMQISNQIDWTIFCNRGDLTTVDTCRFYVTNYNSVICAHNNQY